MYISVDESQMGVSFLDSFRFCMNGTEYNVFLKWVYINMKYGNAIGSLSLDEFKEYYYGDERTTNYRIINKVIVPLIEKMR